MCVQGVSGEGGWVGEREEEAKLVERMRGEGMGRFWEKGGKGGKEGDRERKG